MFTGIVQELGTVKRIENTGSSYIIGITSAVIAGSVNIGDSICVNGACLTAISSDGDTMVFDVMAETVRSTSLSFLQAGDKVNLERALKAGGTLDGHFVLGHIDCVGAVKRVNSSGGEFIISLGFAPGFSRLVVDKGSIAVDGISLTVNNPGNGTCDVHLIPHTMKITTLNMKKAGDKVNLEFDILGKYIDRRMAVNGPSGITEEYLRSKGF